ncbi:MAG: NF038122 family metalloprotease [Cyanobacteria bacterium J06634_5]
MFKPICLSNLAFSSPLGFVVPLSVPLAVPLAIPLAIPLALAPQTAAQAVTFNFDFTRAVSEELQLATREAADAWSPLLKDDAIVKLRVDYSDLSAAGSVLGGVQPGKVKVKYEDYVDALFQDAISSNDFLGVSSLQLSTKGREAFQEYQVGNLDLNSAKLESKQFAFLMDGQFAQGNGKGRNPSEPLANFLDNNGNNNNKNVQLTRAQAKALGLLKDTKNRLDAVITLNSNANWDFDRSDGIAADRYDPVTVMKHEIGHALGIVSGVDTLDFLASASGPYETDDIEKNKFSYLTPMDFYRYSEESAQQGVIDLTIGGSEKYFSLDGGRSVVTDDVGRAAYFSTGSLESQGDGYQGSHWKVNDNPLGVMNPLLQPGQSIDISSLDLTLLDTVGWDLEDSTAERAAAVGVNWTALLTELSDDRQIVIDELLTAQGNEIPELEAAINDASSELEFEFQQTLKDKLAKLTDKFEKEDSFKKRTKEVAKFYEEVGKEAEKRNKDLRKFPEEIYKTDEKVQKWLTLPIDKLSREMQEADATTINRFSNIVKALPADERAVMEFKIEEAVAVFADQPDKLVQELLDTSGPANPIGWSYFRWYWWWLEGKELEDNFEEDDLEFYEDFEDDSDDGAAFFYFQKAVSSSLGSENNSFQASSSITPLSSFNDANDNAKDVPEPSSILATFGIAAISLKTLRAGNRRSRDRRS